MKRGSLETVENGGDVSSKLLGHCPLQSSSSAALIHLHHLHEVARPGHLLLHPVHRHHAVPGLHQASLLGALQGGVQHALRALEGGHLDRCDRPNDLEMGNRRLGGTARKDHRLRPVLGHQPRRAPGLRQHHDELQPHVQGGLHRRRADDVRQPGVGRGVDGGEQALVVDQRLGLHADLVLGLHGVGGEVAVGGLPGEHHAVGAVEHGVGHIAGLRARRPGVGNHALQHLRGGDHRLPGNIRLRDHHLLGQEHLLRPQLHAQVPPGHHHPVHLLQDGVEVPQALLALDLRDQLDPPPPGPQSLADHRDVIRGLGEGDGDEVHALGDGEAGEVLLVRVREGGPVVDDAGEVHVLVLPEDGSVDDLGVHVGVADLGDLHHHATVGQEDLLADLPGRAQLRVATRDAVHIPLERIVRGDFEGLPRL
mmetsp:Transcript_15995/g.38738  ORF Transcript_15995/g.38738 Transcript_15995/m.38738 type:complete len:423 (-) Transcript_15995:417-1685(-)